MPLPSDDSKYVFITLADLLESSRVNTEVTQDDSHDHREHAVEEVQSDGYVSCGSADCPICETEPTEGSTEEFEACTEDCGCDDACEGIDEFFKEIAKAPSAETVKEFYDAADDILSVAIGTLSSLAQDEQSEALIRLEAANSLLGFWELLILGDEEE
jgi:hypothetical protein